MKIDNQENDRKGLIIYGKINIETKSKDKCEIFSSLFLFLFHFSKL